MKHHLIWLLLSLAACGSSVSSTTTGTGGSGGEGCTGSAFACAQFCGSDFFPAQAECQGGSWVCPGGTVDPSTCPPGTCFDAPGAACNYCVDSVITCQPTLACAGACNGTICSVCPEGGVPDVIAGCDCTCDAGAFVCKGLQAGCCNQDADCAATGQGAVCATHVCKPPPAAPGCWTSAQCPQGQTCTGVGVCPCGADCLLPDHPGMCQ
jgi:hypothetical protein